MTASASLPLPREPANYDEISMRQSMLLSDSLKDLKNLRMQLYSAAEYFELSYTIDDKKQMVVDKLKDYAIKAFVNTVDHLGSVTYKVNDLLGEKVDEVSQTEVRVFCIEQRLQTSQVYINREGLSQQLLVINTPKYHKRYILPVGETMNGAIHTRSKYQGGNLDDEDDWRQFTNAIQATIKETPSSTVGKGRYPSPQLSRPPAKILFTGSMSRKEKEKRTASPHPFPLLCTGSLSSMPTTLKSSRSTTPNPSRPTMTNPSRPTTPNSFIGSRKLPVEAWRSALMRLHAERESPEGNYQNPSKNKRLLKTLLSRRKSKKDDMLYTYLDEY